MSELYEWKLLLYRCIPLLIHRTRTITGKVERSYWVAWESRVRHLLVCWTTNKEGERKTSVTGDHC